MNTLSVWNARSPFSDASLVRRSFAGVPQAGFVPAADVVRDGDDAVVRLELPGISTASDVTVEIVGDRLVVRGERRDEQEATERRGPRVREVRYGSFRRSFPLPTHVSADAVSASYDAGVLSVRVAGVHVQPETRRIDVSGVAPSATEATDAPTEGEQAA